MVFEQLVGQISMTISLSSFYRDQRLPTLHISSDRQRNRTYSHVYPLHTLLSPLKRDGLILAELGAEDLNHTQVVTDPLNANVLFHTAMTLAFGIL